MPFRETCAMEERILMLSEYDRGHWSISELCRRHGMSRETFHVWRARRASGEPDWFKDRSHATRACPAFARLSDKEEAIIAARRQFPHLGPRKLLQVLQRALWRDGLAGGLDHRRHLGPAGLVEKTRRRRSRLDPPRRVIAAEAANEEWAARSRAGSHARPAAHRSADDHRQCHAVSDRDAHCAADRRGRAGRVHARFRGLRPAAGDPLRQRRAVRLARRGWANAAFGVVAEARDRTAFRSPASPADGRHERMHRTLKAQTTRPPANDAEEQDGTLDAFRRHYNEERPHEALGQTPAGRRYRPSPRHAGAARGSLVAFHQVRRVRDKGDIKWRGERAFIGEALVGELVGLARAGKRRSCRALPRPRLGRPRSLRRIPPFRSAPYGAPQNGGMRRRPKPVRDQHGPKCQGSIRLMSGTSAG